MQGTRLAAWAVAAWISLTGAAFGHPQDGPDVDLRIQVKDDAILMAMAFNLSFLDEYGLAPREQAGELHPIEQDAVRERLVDFVRSRASVTVDGVDVSPVVREWEVPEPDVSMLPLFPLNGMAAIARVRLVVAYPLVGAPEEVTFHWGAYPPDAVQSTPEDPRTLVIAAQMWANGVSWIHEFTESEPTYHWLASDSSGAGEMLEVPSVPEKRVRRVVIPAVSIGLVGGWVVLGAGIMLFGKSKGRWIVALALLPVFLVGAAVTWDLERIEGPVLSEDWPALTEGEAEAIFEPLHTNIYRSFDYTEEEDVYDALAQSVTGEMLDELYEELAAGLEMQLEDGAAISRVQSVEYMETAFTPVSEAERMSFDVTATWRVTGAVFHWGHSHTRTNEYTARYRVVGSDEGWRIADSQVLSQSRIDATPGAGEELFRPGMEL